MSIETNRVIIAAAITAEMMGSDGLPSHVYVDGLAGSRLEVDAAAQQMGAWVREYDIDDGSAVVSCR